ncbi:MAG: Dabb family protein [Clostridia bacterium]
MIKHIVCFKLAQPTEELLQKTKEILLSMQGVVPEIKAISVGVDVLHSSRSYDIILEVVVENMVSLDTYQNDPYHCGVVKKHMHEVASNSIALDCEI